MMPITNFVFFHRHIDGNHKLIRWRFVSHGGIDGFSRTIVYLTCSDNNRSSTVFSLFVSTANQFHLPRRVRCDHGTENVTVTSTGLTMQLLRLLNNGITIL